jgi:hypothetical protein
MIIIKTLYIYIIYIYIRFEDYLCYGATVMESLAEVMSNTTALEAFNPIPISELHLA